MTASQTLTPEGWDAAMAANLRAPVLLAQAFAAALPAGAEGLIVNIIDQRVLRPTPQFFSYAVSKAGALGRDPDAGAGPRPPHPRQRHRARARPCPRSTSRRPRSTPRPGAVLLGHGATPDEIGQALAYLIDARSVTGQMIAVDGGQHLAWRTPDIIDP